MNFIQNNPLILSFIKYIKKTDRELRELDIQGQYKYETQTGLFLISAVTIFGIYIFYLALSDIETYYVLIQEDGIIEYGSAILWFLAAIIFTFNLYKQIKCKNDHIIVMIFYILLIIFFILCCGEEISWGQRLLKIKTPEMMKAINVQNEITIHNIGSISIFSNAFFLITVLFFLCIPISISKYGEEKTKTYLKFLFPIPNQFVINIYLISLFIWLFVGIRFGTLGFHPFSFYTEHYYTQMDDEIFEFLASYSFFSLSISNSIKHIRISNP